MRKPVAGYMLPDFANPGQHIAVLWIVNSEGKPEGEPRLFNCKEEVEANCGQVPNDSLGKGQ